MSAARALRAGPHALLFEVGELAQARALFAELERWRAARGAAGAELVELVPAARSVLAVARPGAAGRECLEALRTFVERWAPALDEGAPAAAVELAVRYDGPDLAESAALLGLSPEELVRRHCAAQYRVAFCGFAPGFAYLSGVPEALRVPRLPAPRTRVPAGAVGLAGEFTGVYPRESPGGWRLIGRTDAPLWDAERDPPALLAPGCAVRFRPLPA